MNLNLTLRQAPPGRISLFGVTPDRLASMDLAAIEKLPLSWGGERLALAEFFSIGGKPGERMIFDGCDPWFSDLGGGMAGGECEVVGDAGDFLARDMSGGRLAVRGSVGRFAASGLAGGEVHIAGNAGERLGGALPWLAGGMRGGRVVVGGSVGDRCGDKLRRGEIFVGGDAGDFVGTRMVAGTIAVAGRIGAHPGYAMHRGTLLLLGESFAPPPSFVETVMAADAYLGLLWRDWKRRFEADSAFGAFAARALSGAAAPRRWMGDVAADGRGEVFGFGG